MTTMRRFNPAAELAGIQKEFDRWLSPFSSKSKPEAEYESAVWSPLADVSEDKDSYKLRFDVAGLSKDDIQINLTDNKLSVSGERKFESEKQDETTHRIERAYGRFYRSFAFPSAVSAEKIQAQYKDGVLTITVPKADEAKPKQIKIS